MRKTFKFCLYPTKAQQRKFKETLEACRWVYNQALAMRKDAWEQEGRSVTYFETKRMLPIWKQDRPKLSSCETDS